MSGYIYTFEKQTRENQLKLFRPEYRYSLAPDQYIRGGDTLYTTITGEIKDLKKSYSAIGINTSERAYLHDIRCNTESKCEELEEGSEIKTLSDYFIGYNTASTFKIYRKDRIDFAGRTLVKTITGKVQESDHTLGEVAYAQSNRVFIWSYRDNSTRQIQNQAGGVSEIKGLFYMRGELYIVRENAIYKYITTQ